MPVCGCGSGSKRGAPAAPLRSANCTDGGGVGRRTGRLFGLALRPLDRGEYPCDRPIPRPVAGRRPGALPEAFAGGRLVAQTAQRRRERRHDRPAARAARRRRRATAPAARRRVARSRERPRRGTPPASAASSGTTRSGAASTSATSIAARWAGISSCATVPVARTSTPRVRASCSTCARSGPSPTSSSVAPSSPTSASTAWSSAWNLRKLPTQPATKRPSRPRRCRIAVPSTGSSNRSGSTPVGVITIRRSSMPSRRTSVRDRLRPARDDVGGAQRRLLTGQLDPPAPPRPFHAPLLCLPDQRRGDEDHRRHAERASQARTGRGEQLVPLPHAGDVGAVPRSGRIDLERTGAPPVAGVLERGLDHDGDPMVPRRGRGGRELRVGRAAAQVVGRHHAVGRHDPDLTEEPAQSARPTRAADEAGNRALLAGGDRRQHHDRAASGCHPRTSRYLPP